MQTYDDLIELARICVRQAKVAVNQEASAELMRMAREYQQRAAKFNDGNLPDIALPAREPK